MRRIQGLAMAGAMAALIAFAAFPASAADFGDRGFGDGIVFLGDRGFDDGARFFDGFDGAAPASQEFSERRITSGAANPTTRISNTGDNVNLCAPVQQVANTGNVANEQGVVEDNSNGFSTNGFTTDGFGFFPSDNFGFGSDLDFEGSNITIEPSTTADCTQTIDQAATAV
jgi:hypothetical protein